MIKYDYEIKNAFTLADACAPIEKSPFYGIDTPSFVSVCDFYNIDISGERSEFAGGFVLDLWHYIYIKYYDHFIIIDDAESVDPTLFKNWIRLFMNVYLRTKERYITLLNIYNDNKSKLMDQLKTKNTNIAKFNDTPQGSGDYSNDPFTSNITKGESETFNDITTPIARIREIEENYNDTLAQWADDFDGIFIEEGNL